MTAQEAVQQLVQHDHQVLSQAASDEYCKAIGVPLLKGETYEDAYNYGTKTRGVTGVAAHELAVHCCQALKLPYRFMFGKGSSLRECCGVLAKHFGA
jgi:hypothetical protein